MDPGKLEATDIGLLSRNAAETLRANLLYDIHDPHPDPRMQDQKILELFWRKVQQIEDHLATYPPEKNEDVKPTIQHGHSLIAPPIRTYKTPVWSWLEVAEAWQPESDDNLVLEKRFGEEQPLTVPEGYVIPKSVTAQERDMDLVEKAETDRHVPASKILEDLKPDTEPDSLPYEPVFENDGPRGEEPQNPCFDTVFDEYRRPLHNGDRHHCVTYLNVSHEWLSVHTLVLDGQTLKFWTIDEYLAQSG